MIGEIDRLLAERACERLVKRYAFSADFDDPETAAVQYTEAGRLTIAGKTYQGRAAIRARLSDRPAGQVSRHIVTSIDVDIVDADHARGHAYVVLYRSTRNESAPSEPLAVEPPMLVGHYQDSFVRTSEGWLFDERKLVTTFRRSA